MSNHEATILGLDYIRLTSPDDQLQSDADFELTIEIVDGDDSKSPGSQVDDAWDSTVVNITATDVNGDPLVVNQAGVPNSQATVENGTKTITDLSITVALADSPVTIKVETDKTEEDQKPLAGRAYKPFGVITRSVSDVALEFQVTAPTNITRGGSFSFVIQAMLNGLPDTGFTPTADVTLSLVSPSDVDDITVPASKTTDNTGWQVAGKLGQKTVAMTIDGGAGSDTTFIKADDDSSARTGTTIGVNVLDATETLIAQVETEVFAGFSQLSGVNAIQFAAVQNNAQANFEAAGVTLTFAQVSEIVARSVERLGLLDVRARVYSGFIKFTLDNPTDQTGVIAAKLRIRLHSIVSADVTLGPVVYSENASTPLANSRQLLLKTSTNGTLFANGAALKAMTPDNTYPFTTINQESINALAPNPPTIIDPTKVIDLDIPASVITGMGVGVNDLFVWFYFKDSAGLVPFAAPWSDIDSKNPFGGELFDRLSTNHVDTTKLVLLK